MAPFRFAQALALAGTAASLHRMPSAEFSALGDFSFLDAEEEYAVDQSNWTGGMRRWFERRQGHGCGDSDRHGIEPDPSKCLEKDKPDSDCCARPSERSCADGYIPVGTNQWCWGNEYEIYSCYPPGEAPSNPPDTDKCRENGAKDNDCCAKPSEATCADDYIKVMSKNYCYGNTYDRYECYPPGSFGPDVVATTTTTTKFIVPENHDLPDRDKYCKACEEPCDCAKQGRAHCAQCIPCSLFNPGRPCKRDATVIASMIFTPWHLCSENGQCDNDFRATQICRRTIGKIPRSCWVFNNGKFIPHDGPQGTCASIAMKAYAEHNMAQNWRNVDDFKAAFQWNHAERHAWGDRPDAVMWNCDDFCEGWGTPSGELGSCSCACTADAVKNWDKAAERCTTIPRKECKRKTWCNDKGKVIKGSDADQTPCSCDCNKDWRGDRCEIAPDSQGCAAVPNCHGHGFAGGALTPDCSCDCVCWHGETCDQSN